MTSRLLLEFRCGVRRWLSIEIYRERSGDARVRSNSSSNCPRPSRAIVWAGQGSIAARYPPRANIPLPPRCGQVRGLGASSSALTSAHPERALKRAAPAIAQHVVEQGNAARVSAHNARIRMQTHVFPLFPRRRGSTQPFREGHPNRPCDRSHEADPRQIGKRRTTGSLPAPQAKPKKKITVAPTDDSQHRLL